MKNIQKLGFVWLTALALTGNALQGVELEKLINYDWEKSRKPWARVEQQVREAKNPQDIQEIARTMVSVLNSDRAGYPAKQYACRICRRLADKHTIDSLGKLLTDRELSHMSRFALQRNPHPEADKVLIEALGKLEGKLEIGDLGTISLRRDTSIVPRLLEMAKSADRETAHAALIALGNIGTPEVAESLARLDLEDQQQEEAENARLKCAERMLEAGARDEAANIYSSIYQATDNTVNRIAALRGIMLSQSGKKAIKPLLAALSSQSTMVSDAATRFLLWESNPELINALGSELPDLESTEKIVALKIIGSHGRSISTNTGNIVDLLENENDAVRTAAIETLGKVGDASLMPTLLKIAISDDSAADVAFNTLKDMKAPNFTEEVIDNYNNASGARKVCLIELMSTRSNADYAPVLITAMRSEDADISSAAISGLVSVAETEHIKPMVEFLLSTDSKTKKQTLLRTIVRTALRSEDVEARSAPINAMFSEADPYEKQLLMKALERLGGTESLNVVGEQMNSENEDVQAMAVRTLANWNTPDAADHLLDFVEETSRSKLKNIALGGYINAAKLMAKDSVPEALAMYKKALDLANSEKQTQAILAGLSQMRNIEALELAKKMLAREGLEEEARLAVVNIAEKAGSNAPLLIEKTLNELTSEDNDMRKRMESIVESAKEDAGFITDWIISGPYIGNDPFDEQYTPEDDDKQAAWQTLEKGLGEKTIDLGKAIGGDNRCIYAKTAIWSPKERKVVFSMGSDDGIKVWLNNDLLHANDISRAVRIGDDEVTTTLQKGWNTLMTKVSQGGGDWGFSVRLLDKDGKPLYDFAAVSSKADT